MSENTILLIQFERRIETKTKFIARVDGVDYAVRSEDRWYARQFFQQPLHVIVKSTHHNVQICGIVDSEGTPIAASPTATRFSLAGPPLIQGDPIQGKETAPAVWEYCRKLPSSFVIMFTNRDARGLYGVLPGDNIRIRPANGFDAVPGKSYEVFAGITGTNGVYVLPVKEPS